ncbi:MAG: hypothetical protein DMG32_22335 [Acidobacteria bacterium]|nr:MAG: hypothetical protein DMG32_22335 [Acidobacteriota bacterium]
MNGRFTRIRWTPAKRNKITGEIWVPDKLRLRETFQINQWGNLNKILPYPGKPQPENLNQMAGNNNRFTGMSYDAAGNLLNDGASAYFYDAETRIQTGAGVTYTYDGDGKRVQKSTGKLYWYGMGSDPLDESDASGNLTDEYVFFGGKRMARRDVSSGNIFYYFSDHLGTSRVILQAGQIIPCYDADFYPFGGERIVTNTCPQNYKFTGKERDTESGLDDFGAPYYASSLGRFATPDPIQHPNQSSWDEETFLATPQRWNEYAYVLNNPLNHTDPTGSEIPVWEKRLEGTPPRTTKEALGDIALVAGAGAVAVGGEALAGAGVLARAATYGSGLITAAIGYLLTPQGQQNTTNITQAIGDYVTGSVSPGPAALGEAREAAVAASVGGRISGMTVTVANVGRTDVDVIGKAGELIAVGGPAKGLDLAKLGNKLSILKTAAMNVGTTAKAYFEAGTAQTVIDLAKKILGEKNVVVFKIVKKKQ